jgi:hypothetical protein
MIKSHTIQIKIKVKFGFGFGFVPQQDACLKSPTTIVTVVSQWVRIGNYFYTIIASAQQSSRNHGYQS